MTKDKALKMALEALTTFERICSPEHLHIYETITIPEAVKALRQALTEPDMGIDRGAWDDVPDATKWVDELRGDDETEEEPVGQYSDIVSDGGLDPRNQYDTAPPKREWVGLTDEERYLNDCRSEEDIEYARAIEAKLREKNGF